MEVLELMQRLEQCYDQLEEVRVEIDEILTKLEEMNEEEM